MTIKIEGYFGGLLENVENCFVIVIHNTTIVVVLFLSTFFFVQNFVPSVRRLLTNVNFSFPPLNPIAIFKKNILRKHEQFSRALKSAA